MENDPEPLVAHFVVDEEGFGEVSNCNNNNNNNNSNNILKQFTECKHCTKVQACIYTDLRLNALDIKSCDQ